MRGIIAKAVRRDMRRAMGEGAVQQVETQTDALGAHETRIHVLEDQQAQTWKSLRIATDLHLRFIEDLQRHEQTRELRRAHIMATFWSRLRWLLLGR